jgi:autotransporter-associated beta strand protein
MRRLWIVLVVLTAACGALAETIDPGDYAQAVRIRFGGYGGSTPLTNFPALVTFADGERGFRYSDMESDDYSDLRFTAADGTSSIPYEVEAWNATGPAAVQPTDTAGCALWLKADAGALTNALGAVTNWLDQSGSGNNATLANGNPMLVNGAANGQPVVRFDGTDDRFTFAEIANIRTVFWVLREDADASGDQLRPLLSHSANPPHWHRGANKMIWAGPAAGGWGSAQVYNGETRINGAVVDGSATVVPTNNAVVSLVTTANVRANQLGRDRTAWATRVWKGDFAEVIIYDRALAPREMAGVSLYLEGKYGIDVAADTFGTTPSTVWVQVPLLTNNATIYAYWGNTNATAIPSYTTNGATWDAHYLGVWHLHGTNSAGHCPDSTTNGRAGVKTDSLTADGLMGDAQDFNGTSSFIDTGEAFLGGRSAFTITAWVNLNGLPGGNVGICGQNDSIEYGLNGAGQNAIWASGGGSMAGTALGVGSWTYVGAQGGTNSMALIHNGTTDGTNTHTGGAYDASGDTVKIGGRVWGPNGGHINGLVDEVRVSDIERPADWLLAEYANVADPDGFLSVEKDAFWDTSAAAGLQAGDGTWSTTDAGWSAIALGSNPLRTWEDGATASFTADGVSTVSVATVTAYGMIVDGSGYSFTGGSLTVDEGGVAANESVTIGSALSLSGVQDWSVATGRTLTVAGTVGNGGNRLTVRGEGDAALAGVVSGTGELAKDDTGTLSLDAYHTYTGGTVVNGGTLLLSKGGATGAILGMLMVNPDATVDYATDNTFGWTAGASVNVLNIDGGRVGGADYRNHFWNNFRLNMTGGTLHLGGTLNEFQNTTVTVQAGATTARILSVTSNAVMRLRDGTSALFDVGDGSEPIDLLLDVPIVQHLAGSGITKNGGGTMSITRACLYDGGTTVNNGTLLVNNAEGSGVGSGTVTLNGGTLGGTGTVGAAVSVGTGGFVSPGDSVGRLRIEGDLDLTSTGTAGLYVELDATNVYDVLTVTGLVTLGDAMLVGEVGYAPASNDTFFILVNEGTDAIVGTFEGVAQGGSVEIDGHTFSVSYEGDSATGALTGGNDVVLYNGTETSGPGGGDAPYWLRLDIAGYTRPTPLTNFPALVLLREDLEGFSFSGFLSGSGDDLRFFDGTNAGKSELNYEIEAWHTNADSHVWVQIPTLTNGTTIWAYWGDTNMTTSPAYTTNGAAWDSTFLGVWHFADAGGGSNAVLDSTANTNHATDAGSPVFGADGAIGPAIDFAGSGQHVQLPDMGTTNRASVEFWFKGDDLGGIRGLVAHRQWIPGAIHSSVRGGNDMIAHMNGGGLPTAYDGLGAGRWHHGAYTFAGAGLVTVFRDGLARASDAGGGNDTLLLDEIDVAAENSGRWFDGVIDEVRISGVSRSEDWMWASYWNQRDPVRFMGLPARASHWDTSVIIGLQAGDGTWDTGTTAMWSGDPSLGDDPLLTWNPASRDAHFSAAGSSLVTVNDATAERVYFDAAGTMLAGGTLTIRDGVVASESATIGATVDLWRDQEWAVASGRTVTCTGTLSGIGRLTKTGTGMQVMNNGNHTLSGGLVINDGTLRAYGGSWTRSFFANVSPRFITVNDGGRLETSTHNLGGLGAAFYQPLVTVNEGGTWHLHHEQYLNGNNLDLHGGTIHIAASDLRLQGGTVDAGGAATASVISGNQITLHGNTLFRVADGAPDTDLLVAVTLGQSGTQSMTKTGGGKMIVTGANTYSGGTQIDDGLLVVNNASGFGTGPGAVTINGGALGGTGTVAAAVAFGVNGGAIAPGSDTGTLTVNSNVTFTTAGAKSLDVRVNGAADYSQLAVNGGVVLDGATLNVSVADGATDAGMLFVIVNDGTDPVTGTFAGLSEGQTFTVTDDGGSDIQYTVHYAGNSATGSTAGGNDVVLATGAPGTLLLVR